jgi:drug/metabolite transporter (DMT)-like permease
MFAYLLLGETMGKAGLAGGGIIALAVYMVASTSVENSSLSMDDAAFVNEEQISYLPQVMEKDEVVDPEVSKTKVQR